MFLTYLDFHRENICNLLGEPSTLQRVQSRKTIVKHLYLLQTLFTPMQKVSLYTRNLAWETGASPHTLYLGFVR